MKPTMTGASDEDYVSSKLGYNPWQMARKKSAEAQSNAEIDELVKSGMITPEQAQKAKGSGGDSLDAINQDPKFLDKVFKK